MANKEELLEVLMGLLDSSPKQKLSDDFIPSTMTYSHEPKPTSISEMVVKENTFTPIDTPVPVPAQLPTKTPELALAPTEQDLVKVLKHLLEEEGQTLHTVENVFIQQALRILIRIEEKVAAIEEQINDELFAYLHGKEADTTSQKLVFKNAQEESKQEEYDSEENIEEEYDFADTDVQTSRKPVKRKRKNARQRRRDRRNRKNTG